MLGKATLKSSDWIVQYSGEEDFLSWVQKVELVAKLQDINNLCSFLPLFLKGGALDVYNGLNEDVKCDYKLLKNALKQVFSMNSLI